MDAPGGGEHAVLVVRAPPGAQFPDRGVDQRVARAGVERHGIGARRQHGDVGDPPDVQGRGHAGAPAQEHQVDQADQGSPLPARRHVPRPKAGDDRAAAALRDPGRFAELQRAVHPAVLGPVVHRLPVRGDQLGAPRAQFPVGAGGDGREGLADPGVEAADVGQGGRRGRQGGGEGLPHVGRVRLADHAEGHQLQGAVLGGRFQVGGSGVDGVVRGPRHQPDHPHRSGSRWARPRRASSAGQLRAQAPAA